MGADMVSLATVRREAVTALNEAGIDAVHWTSPTINPPCAIVSLGEPYVDRPTPDETATFAAPWMANLVIELVTGRGPSEEVADALDEMITTALRALTTGTIPGDSPAGPARIEVRAPLIDANNIVGAHLLVSIPHDMKES